MKKNILFLFVILFFNFSISSQIYTDRQMIPSDHWIYSALSTLETENAICGIVDCAPASVSEIKNSFYAIDFDSLSDSGKELYRKVENYLTPKKAIFDLNPVKLSGNLIFYPEVLYKSNDEIDWTFATDYTGHKAFNYEKKKWEVQNYGAASNFSGNKLTDPFLQLPLIIDFGNLICIESDLFVGKSFWGMQNSKNFTNILYKGSDADFLWPTYAYGSAGYYSETGWGIDFHAGKQGMQIGRSLTGSVIYNDTFQTDFYAQINLYSRRFKYNLDVIQVYNRDFLYIHNIEFIPFKWIKLGVVEGTLINSPFEIRYLNPLMIFHSFGSWTEYKNKAESEIYGESHSCAYLGITFDIVPCRNLRIYGLFAQTEIQPPNELGSPYGRLLPNGVGIQSGVEYHLPDSHKGYYKFTLEGFYISPFLYIKQSNDWTLYRKRFNMQSNDTIPICSWIGSPFGPDSAGFEFQVSYEKINKWNIDLSYLFVAHGTNSFGMFNYEYENGKGVWSAFYPSVVKNLGLITQEQGESIARTMALTGVLQLTNQISLNGSYEFNKHFTFDAGVVYSFIFNNKNENGVFAQGVQLSAALKYSLF